MVASKEGKEKVEVRFYIRSDVTNTTVVCCPPPPVLPRSPPHFNNTQLK